MRAGIDMHGLSVEPNALKSAMPVSRDATASSHWKTNSSGMVIAFAAFSYTSAPLRSPASPKTAHLMRGSTATKRTPIAVPIETPQ
jgi:hypothetical protein